MSVVKPPIGCKYYPCHEGLSDAEFDCEFCYCPAYFIPNCGGNYHVLPNGIKDCSDCTLPHCEAGKVKVRERIRDYEIHG